MFPEKISKHLRWKSRSKSSILVVVACLGGCDHIAISRSEVKPNQPFIHKMDDFLPLNSGSKESVFTVDGTRTNYQLRSTTKGTTVTFQALSDGKVVDEEVYDVQDKMVLLKTAAGENFDPPVVLLRFPLTVGDQYSWKGKLCCDIEKINGSATVVTSTDYVPRNEKNDDAIKAEMNLSFGEGASRKLSFWFVKGKGVVKTQMYKNTREPKQ
jgi:hypothetical protein